MVDDVQWYVSLARETGKPVIGSLLHLRTWAEKRGPFAWNVFAFSPFVAVSVEGTRQTRRASWHEGVIPLWWLTRAEQEGPVDVAGLEVEALDGCLHREPLVWVARKQAA